MKWLITGGAGFIGTNTVLSLFEKGQDISVVDDLSRPGVEENADFITKKTGLAINRIDITNQNEFGSFLKSNGNFDVILNLAGQVSLLESIRNPMRDFAVNAIAPIQILEHIRINSPSTLVINMSSNKIYGSLEHINIKENTKRYSISPGFNGFAEDTQLDFHGPYGCSKGTADQYFNDYRRIYGLRTISLRQSAVYGPFQKPMSDQGWLAFMIQEAVAGRVISLNGVGKQVRDLLHVSDLGELFFAFANSRPQLDFSSYNVGGGVRNQISILELFELLEESFGIQVKFETGELRPGDQKYFVSDNSRVQSVTNWQPQIDIADGIKLMIEAELKKL